MKPEARERLLELAERATNDTAYVTPYDPPWTTAECGEVAEGLRELLDERRGAEAEELRAGLEKIMADAPGGDLDSNHEWNAALQVLLDEVDARDSLAHVEQKQIKAPPRLGRARHRDCTHESAVLLHYNYVPNPVTGKFDGENHGMQEIKWCPRCGAHQFASYNARGENIPREIGSSEWVKPNEDAERA